MSQVTYIANVDNSFSNGHFSMKTAVESFKKFLHANRSKLEKMTVDHTCGYSYFGPYADEVRSVIEAEVSASGNYIASTNVHQILWTKLPEDFRRGLDIKKWLDANKSREKVDTKLFICMVSGGIRLRRAEELPVVEEPKEVEVGEMDVKSRTGEMDVKSRTTSLLPKPRKSKFPEDVAPKKKLKKRDQELAQL